MKLAHIISILESVWCISIKKKDHDFEYSLVTKKYIETSNRSSSALANPDVKMSSLDTPKNTTFFTHQVSLSYYLLLLWVT